MPIADDILALAQRLAHGTPAFQDRLGPGNERGNGATNRYLAALNAAVKERWPTQCRLQEPVADGVGYSFDYFVPQEKTAIEIALSLRNIVTEYEKDVFKAILAKERGKELSKLILIGKSGSVPRQNQPGPVAIREWVRTKCGVEVEVKEIL